jgi:hypothetical protein
VHDDTDGAAPAAVPMSLLADLQAGLLDDAAAARLRHRARTDPHVAGQLAALDRVRRDLAGLGVDAASAPDLPAEVTARVGTALRSLPPPANRVVTSRGSGTAHTARVSVSGWRRTAAVAGIAAAIAAAGVGSTMLLRDEPTGRPATGPTESSITVPRAPGGVPLSDQELLALLTQPPDLAALAAPQRLASCLSGLGYPTSTSPLGARPLAVIGRPGVLVLLPGDMPGRIRAVVVGPNCNSADTGLLASTVINRP